MLQPFAEAGHVWKYPVSKAFWAFSILMNASHSVIGPLFLILHSLLSEKSYVMFTYCLHCRHSVAFWTYPPSFPHVLLPQLYTSLLQGAHSLVYSLPPSVIFPCLHSCGRSSGAEGGGCESRHTNLSDLCSRNVDAWQSVGSDWPGIDFMVGAPSQKALFQYQVSP